MKKLKSPHDLLPVPPPYEEAPEELDYFYQNIMKPLIPDVLRIMMNGIPVSYEKIEELRKHLDNMLNDIKIRLADNKIIKSYLSERYGRIKKEYIEERKTHLKTINDFIKPFDSKNVTHRSYIMHVVEKDTYIDFIPNEQIAEGISKWTVNDLKKISIKPQLVLDLLDKRDISTTPEAIEAMELIAVEKMRIHNKKYLSQIEEADTADIYPPFNPNSPDQKHDVLTGILGYESDKLTDAYTEYEQGKREIAPKNKYSWNRDNVENIQKIATDEEELKLFQALIDQSFAGIVRTNFIAAFDRYVIDGVLYGNLKLAGAKSFRLTSNNPNLLNLPSTGSIYSKPLKECLIAPDGFVIYTIDYSSLEDRVMASISGDKNKCNVFLENLDGHCLNAYGYFKDRIEKEMKLTGDTTTDVKEFYKLVEEGNKKLKAIRQDGKPATLIKR